MPNGSPGYFPSSKCSLWLPPSTKTISSFSSQILLALVSKPSSRLLLPRLITSTATCFILSMVMVTKQSKNYPPTVLISQRSTQATAIKNAVCILPSWRLNATSLPLIKKLVTTFSIVIFHLFPVLMLQDLILHLHHLQKKKNLLIYNFVIYAASPKIILPHILLNIPFTNNNKSKKVSCQHNNKTKSSSFKNNSTKNSSSSPASSMHSFPSIHNSFGAKHHLLNLYCDRSDNPLIPPKSNWWIYHVTSF